MNYKIDLLKLWKTNILTVEERSSSFTVIKLASLHLKKGYESTNWVSVYRCGCHLNLLNP
jgi:hypothetical protein